jgi:hypothetical protein
MKTATAQIVGERPDYVTPQEWASFTRTNFWIAVRDHKGTLPTVVFCALEMMDAAHAEVSELGAK